MTKGSHNTTLEVSCRIKMQANKTYENDYYTSLANITAQIVNPVTLDKPIEQASI